jgi:hypothetical protein
MLMLSLLASAAAAVILALVLYLAVLIYAGRPCVLLCLMRAGYLLPRRRHTDARHGGTRRFPPVTGMVLP